ncbi:MAG: hypothetical protein RSD08_00710 [Oscillospiraceae bacterium]
MNTLSIEEKIKRHLIFWNGEHQSRPLLCMRLGQVFFSKQFKANLPLLEKNRVLKPEEIIVDDYLADYERMFQELEQLPQDCIFTAEPCTGIPWLEAIFGAVVVGGEDSFFTKPIISDTDDLKKVRFDRENPWFQKYIEFSQKLNLLSAGRFPIGEPILRGVTDTVGSLIGQQDLIYAMMDEPELINEKFEMVANAQRELIKAQYAVTDSFHGGRSFGFYHLWAPGSVMWYQNDLTNLMAPSFYDEFIRKPTDMILEGYDYTMVHLHPISFFHLDGLLSQKNLSAIQVNRESFGYPTEDCIPSCRKIIESGKKLLYGLGPIDEHDIDVLYDGLPHHSTMYNLMAETPARALELFEYIDGKNW